jgi:hypothetical protein
MEQTKEHDEKQDYVCNEIAEDGGFAGVCVDYIAGVLR